MVNDAFLTPRMLLTCLLGRFPDLLRFEQPSHSVTNSGKSYAQKTE